MKEKRFISDDGFEIKLTIEEFNKILEGQNVHYFNENGLVSDQCPRCGFCNEGFVQLDIPNPATLTGMIDLQLAQARMQYYLKLHVDKLVDVEVEKMRTDIEKKIKERFPSITRHRAAASLDASET
jgi:hypothetical protein